MLFFRSVATDYRSCRLSQPLTFSCTYAMLAVVLGALAGCGSGVQQTDAAPPVTPVTPPVPPVTPPAPPVTPTTSLAIATIATHTFGDAPFAVTTNSNSPGGVTLSIRSGPASLSANQLTLKGAGAVTVHADQAASGTYPAATADATFTVLKGVNSLYFLPIDTDHVVGETAFVVPASSTSSNTSPITYSITSGPATYTGNLLQPLGAGAVTVHATQAADGNFNAADATASFSINKGTPVLEFPDATAHTFGDSPFVIRASAVSGPGDGIVYSIASGPATINGNVVTLTGAGDVTVRATRPADANYITTSALQPLTVQKAANAVTLDHPTAVSYGDPPFTIQARSNTASTGAFTYTVVSGPATISGNTVTLTGGGTLTLRAVQASDANYSAANASTTITVRGATAALQFAAIPRHVYGDAPFTVSASSGSPAPITYSVTSGPATISGDTVTITGVGQVSLLATQPASGPYPATSAQQTLTIGRGNPQLTFPAVSGIIDGDPPAKLQATTRSTSPVTYSVLSGPATLTGNSLAFTGSGNVVVSAQIVADTNYTSATVQQTIPVAVANTSPVGLIKHVVVIFQENVSFDHYFGTYPVAQNNAGEPAFTALPDTPTVDGLQGSLLTANPNKLNPRNGAGAVNPYRLSRAMAATADQDHGYSSEQLAFNNGAMDLFPRSVGAADGPNLSSSGPSATTGLTMGYYDGNTVTGMWNYAQHFAMSDRFFGTNFGPSTPGALNLISGQTNGAVNDGNAAGLLVPDGYGGFTVIADPQPVDDVCDGPTSAKIHMTGRNIGDMLNDAGISWGFFQGGFDTTVTNPNGSTGCRRSHTSAVTGRGPNDYLPHHQPFQYYATTANPTHVRPASVGVIGKAADKGANHQYDTHDFADALAAGNFPEVSFLKAPAFQDGHAGYSDPLDEQNFVVSMINLIQSSPQWKDTAILIAYDDSDGWYDHAYHVINGSRSSYDNFTSAGVCADGSTALPGVATGATHAQGRCGYGPRLPFIVVSPWAKPNFVASTVIDQTSIMRFIEDTFLQSKRLGNGSFDSISGEINSLFDFRRPTPQNMQNLQLNVDTGLVSNK